MSDLRFWMMLILLFCMMSMASIIYQRQMQLPSETEAIMRECREKDGVLVHISSSQVMCMGGSQRKRK